MKVLCDVRRLIALSTAAAVLTAAGACFAPVRMPSPGEREPDRYLYERGSEALAKKHWLDAKEYFQRIVDAYPQSPYRQGARLGIGDSQLGESGYSSLILAAETFREFLRFYPLNERADYAQYRLAVSQFKQMLSPDRDQTSTIDALKEFEIFVRVYPDSKYMTEALAFQRQARTRLSDSELNIGIQYYRMRWYPGAIPRIQNVLKQDPAYLKRDAAYFYLAESFYKANRKKEALPYYDKLIEEFKVSDYLERAKLRTAELAKDVSGTDTAPSGSSVTVSPTPTTPKTGDLAP